MKNPAASSGVSKTTTGKILRPKGRGIHPDGIKLRRNECLGHQSNEKILLKEAINHSYL
jgi:hypothetical protein